MRMRTFVDVVARTCVVAVAFSAVSVIATEPDSVLLTDDPWTMEKEAVRAAWIVDDFEDGNIDDWIDEGAGLCTASTSAITAHGSYSMRVDGACGGHMLGKVKDIPPSQPTGATVWLRSDTAGTLDTYFIMGDTSSGPTFNFGAVNFSGIPGVWRVIVPGNSLTCQSRNPNQWYQVRFDIDWACKMYDVSIDGVPCLTNVDFYDDQTEYIERIHVYNWDAGTTARYDTISFETPPVSPLLFEDNFERMSTCRWSSTSP